DRGIPKPDGEGVDLLLHLGELDLQLRHVDALGLRLENAPPQKLELLLELLVRAPKLVPLGRHLRERGLRTGKRSLRAAERRLQLLDATDQCLALRTLAGHIRAHGATS